MSATAVAAMQPIWDCKWSRPGLRLAGLAPGLQPEPLWVCTRTGERKPVSEDKCEACPFWELEDCRWN